MMSQEQVRRIATGLEQWLKAIVVLQVANLSLDAYTAVFRLIFPLVLRALE